MKRVALGEPDLKKAVFRREEGLCFFPILFLEDVFLNRNIIQ